MKNVVLGAKVKKKKYEIVGDMIFTHFGISGPGILKLSSYINRALENGKKWELLQIFLQDKSKDEISKLIREIQIKQF